MSKSGNPHTTRHQSLSCPCSDDCCNLMIGAFDARGKVIAAGRISADRGTDIAGYLLQGADEQDAKEAGQVVQLQ